MPRRAWSSAIGGLSAVLVLSGSALAGGWTSPIILRATDPGVPLVAGDLATQGSHVVAGWTEAAAGYVRWSVDGGDGFDATHQLDARPTKGMAVDTCDGWAWAAATLRTTASPPHQWHVALNGWVLSGPSYERSQITHGGVSRDVDLACVGDRRLALAYLQKVSGHWRLKVFSRTASRTFGDDPPDQAFDLGVVASPGGLAIAATNDRVYVTWFAAGAQHLKRFDVAAGPHAMLSARPTQLLSDHGYQFTPKIAADGSRVVIAWTDHADLVARVSTNGGTAWGPRRILEDMPFPSEVGSWPTNADIDGSRIIVGGGIVGGSTPQDFSGEGFVDRSLNDGAGWARVPGTRHADGRALGAYVRIGGVPRVAVTWDQWVANPLVERLRFGRQS